MFFQCPIPAVSSGSELRALCVFVVIPFPLRVLPPPLDLHHVPASLAPSGRTVYYEGSRVLKPWQPWAEFCSPCGAGPRSIYSPNLERLSKD